MQQKLSTYFSVLVLSLFFFSCQQKTSEKSTSDSVTATAEDTASSPATAVSVKDRKPADAATILARKQVPILCYHQIRDWKSSDSKSAKDYIIPVNTFKEHMKMLADSGYHSVLPD